MFSTFLIFMIVDPLFGQKWAQVFRKKSDFSEFWKNVAKHWAQKF